MTGRVEGKGPVLAILSGGNIDATLLMSVARRGLSAAGRYLVVRTRVPDRQAIGERGTGLSTFGKQTSRRRERWRLAFEVFRCSSTRLRCSDFDGTFE